MPEHPSAATLAATPPATGRSGQPSTAVPGGAADGAAPASQSVPSRSDRRISYARANAIGRTVPTALLCLFLLLAVIAVLTSQS